MSYIAERSARLRGGEVGAQRVGEAAEADGGEEVDREAHVGHRVAREDAAREGRHLFGRQPSRQRAQAQVLRQLLHTRTRARFCVRASHDHDTAQRCGLRTIASKTWITHSVTIMTRLPKQI